MQLGKYISGYCDPEVNEDTLEAALAAVLAHPGTCNGITYEPVYKVSSGARQGKFTGRAGTSISSSQHGEISWFVHDESGDSSNCYTPPSPPPHFRAECNTHKGFYSMPWNLNGARDADSICPPGDELTKDECQEFWDWWLDYKMSKHTGYGPSIHVINRENVLDTYNDNVNLPQSTCRRGLTCLLTCVFMCFIHFCGLIDLRVYCIICFMICLFIDPLVYCFLNH